MLSQPEVIEVEESVFPLLLYPDPGEAYRQRLGQYLKRIDASTGNINGPPVAWLPGPVVLAASMLWRELR